MVKFHNPNFNRFSIYDTPVWRYSDVNKDWTCKDNTIQYNIRLLILDRMQADNTGSGYA